MGTLIETTDQNLELPYDGQLQTEVTYYTFTGNYPLPVSGGPNASISLDIVTTHARFTLKVVDWVASRYGNAPRVPAPDVIDNEHITISEVIGGVAPDLGPNGDDIVYSMAGTYVYALNSPRGPRDEVQLATLPNNKLDKEDSRVRFPADRFFDAITSKPPNLLNPLPAGGSSQPIF